MVPPRSDGAAGIGLRPAATDAAVGGMDPGPASRNCSGPQDRGSVAAEAVGAPALGVRPAGSRQEPAKQIEQAQ